MATMKKVKAKIKPKLSKKKPAPAPTTPTGDADYEAVCASCGVIFTKKDPKPGSKCDACSKK